MGGDSWDGTGLGTDVAIVTCRREGQCGRVDLHYVTVIGRTTVDTDKVTTVGGVCGEGGTTHTIQTQDGVPNFR